MKFFLWMEQSGGGCDYTIGCGNALVELTGAETIEQAREAVAEKLDYYGIGGEERRLDNALILSAVESAMPQVAECTQKRAEARSKAENDRKRAELERLKRELGEK